MADKSEVDLINRDPNNINDHLSCHFEDVLAEPESTHSIDCVWKLSFTCFNFWKNICYKIQTILCGICIAAEWGCEFAYISFVHIWCFTPFFKALDINCGCAKKMYGMCVRCCVEPCCEACGLLFSAFKK
ncbi:hypothetical protein CHS0354_038406 [Potamilus streckersoni]|uniref:Caveolin n=1 Tax=Potamilus streckersoni TaxID=2493646 RepID=A0AAE0S648_9BIVA|nr:hypothetical protein CHS0354_038406 [Potamilus streckersoni]